RHRSRRAQGRFGPSTTPYHHVPGAASLAQHLQILPFAQTGHTPTTGPSIWCAVPMAGTAGALSLFPRRRTMNWDQIQGSWKQVTGKVKEKWGKLTDDDLTTIAGKRDQLAGKLQERYGYAKDRAEKELDEFARNLKM